MRTLQTFKPRMQSYSVMVNGRLFSSHEHRPVHPPHFTLFFRSKSRPSKSSPLAHPIHSQSKNKKDSRTPSQVVEARLSTTPDEHAHYQDPGHVPVYEIDIDCQFAFHLLLLGSALVFDEGIGFD